MGLRRLLVPFVALLVAAGLVLGLVSGAFGSLARQGLEAAGLQTTAAVPTAIGSAASSPSDTTPTASVSPAPSASSSAALPAPVLVGAEGKGDVLASEVAKRVAGAKVKGSGGYSGEVRDMRTGDVVFSHRAGKGAIPASTTKLVTSAAVLDLLGPEHRFTTAVVSPGKGRIVLVGGGDPYLEEKASKLDPTRATLSALARSTARALKANGVRKVSLGYDGTRFSGPSWHSTWPDTYADVASHVSALWVNEGRAIP